MLVAPPGRASGLSLTGNTASFRAGLWSNLEKLTDNIYTTYSQVRLRQTDRQRDRQTSTHTTVLLCLSLSV